MNNIQIFSGKPSVKAKLLSHVNTSIFSHPILQSRLADHMTSGDTQRMRESLQAILNAAKALGINHPCISQASARTILGLSKSDLSALIDSGFFHTAIYKSMDLLLVTDLLKSLR